MLRKLLSRKKNVMLMMAETAVCLLMQSAKCSIYYFYYMEILSALQALVNKFQNLFVHPLNGTYNNVYIIVQKKRKPHRSEIKLNIDCVWTRYPLTYTEGHI